MQPRVLVCCPQVGLDLNALAARKLKAKIKRDTKLVEEIDAQMKRLAKAPKVVAL